MRFKSGSMRIPHSSAIRFTEHITFAGLNPHSSLRGGTGRHKGSKTLLMQGLSFFDSLR
jgi:hypothetical protein